MTNMVRQPDSSLIFSRGLDKDKRLVVEAFAFNKGATPHNFGVENVSLYYENGDSIVLFGYEELIRQAERKAGWAKFWVGLAGAADIIAASQTGYTSTYGHVHTSYGSASFHAETYNPSIAYANMDSASDTAVYRFAQIQNSLETVRLRLNKVTLRTTTVDPGNAFGGLVVSDEIEGKYPRTITLKVAWGGDAHTFTFVVTKGDQPTPPLPAAASVEATAIVPPANASEWTPAPDYPGSASPQDYGPPPPQSEVRPGITIPYQDEQ